MNSENSSKQQIYNPISSMQPGEEVICEIRRHPIGLYGTYFMGVVLVIVVGVLAFAVAPTFVTAANRGRITEIGALVFAIVTLFTLLFTFVARKIYWGNRWIVTTDSITQLTQISLFDNQSSQLSLGNLEDVTAEQNGIFPHMLNYGFLKVETAGEHSKFQFNYCPDPNRHAQQILHAREQFEQGRRGENPQRLYRDEGTYNAPAAPQAQPPQDSGTPPSAPPPPPAA